MCRYLIDPRRNAVPIQVRDASFVQVVNTALLPLGSYKPEQYRLLESDINAHLPSRGSVLSYSLIAGRPEAFLEGTERERLREIVKGLVWGYELLDVLNEPGR
jgi:hypothetical protein